MAEIREITSGLEFPEGPIAMDDGSVILTEIKRGTLTRVKPDGTKEVVAETGDGPNGAAIGPDGKCYVCNNGGFEWIEAGGLTVPHGIPESYTNGYIQRVDIDTGAVETIYTECDGNKLCGPNDIVFDAQGGMWFSDFGKIRDRDRDVCGLYYAKTDGSFIKEVVYPIQGPNGIGLAPGDATLYAAQTFEAPGVGLEHYRSGRIGARGRGGWSAPGRSGWRGTGGGFVRLPVAGFVSGRGQRQRVCGDHPEWRH